MSDVMIRVENLGKRYMIGHQSEGGGNYDTLRDALSDGAKSLVRRFTGRSGERRPTQEEFWALKNVSFEVKRGECVGIIGRNGAGKSTLLKILSRITEPTTGRIELNGRVASLLEVGTGFHPELTGRENIYLNGAILGMSRAEIKAKFDEIVDFAEVEKFLDTPVKRYSSGMYVRLAFAVAAHLEPEILVVDEVLAVGDAAFQKKCLGKMGDVSEKEGRTVLFVSHNMAAIQRLCSKAMLFKQGRMQSNGNSIEVINNYLYNSESDDIDFDLSATGCRKGEGELYFSKFRLINNLGREIDSVLCGDSLTIRLYFDSKLKTRIFKNCRIGLSINNLLGASILLSTEMTCINTIEIKANDYIDFYVPKFPLSQGFYYVTLFAESNGVVQDWLIDYIKITVDGGDFYGFGKQCPIGHEGKNVLIDFSFTKGTVENEQKILAF